MLVLYYSLLMKRIGCVLMGLDWVGLCNGGGWYLLWLCGCVKIFYYVRFLCMNFFENFD